MEEHEIPGTSVKVVRVAGEDANAYGSGSGKAASKRKRQRYRTMEEKVKDIERYLIWQVDSIRKWVILAVGVSVISWAAVIALLLAVLNPPSGDGVTGKAEGAAEPEARAAATENRNFPETTVAQKADRAVADAADDTARPDSAADDAGEARAAAADTVRIAPKGKPAAARVEAKAGGATADLGQKADAEVAVVREQALLAVARGAREKQAAALPVPAESDARAKADRTAPEKESPPSEPPGQALAEDPSPAAVTDTAAAPIPSPPSEPPAGTGKWSFRIGASAIASRMAGLVPTGTANRFSANQNRLYCWTRIESDSFSEVPKNLRYVVHRWIHKGETIRERKITIGSPRYRTYSVLPSPGDRPGEWRVEIIDADKRVIGSEEFVIE